MFVPKTTIKRLEAGIARQSLAISKKVNTDFTKSGDSVYYAAVDFLRDTNSNVEAVNNVYKYDATLYYKQFSPSTTEEDEYDRDVDLTQYQASDSVILLSAWDLKSLVDEKSEVQTAVVPCIQRNNYFECLAEGGASPDNLIDRDDFGQSVDLRTAEVNGISTTAWELLGFYKGLSTPITLDDVISADTETGDITGAGASNYKILVRVDNVDGRPKLGYMPIHLSDDPDYPDDEEDEDCGVGNFPGTLPNDLGDDEDENGDNNNAFPGDNGIGNGNDDNDFPGKVDECW